MAANNSWLSLLGFDRDKAIGFPLGVLLSGPGGGLIIPALEHVAESQNAVVVRTLVRRARSGETIQHVISIRPLVDASGDIHSLGVVTLGVFLEEASDPPPRPGSDTSEVESRIEEIVHVDQAPHAAAPITSPQGVACAGGREAVGLRLGGHGPPLPPPPAAQVPKRPLVGGPAGLMFGAPMKRQHVGPMPPGAMPPGAMMMPRGALPMMMPMMPPGFTMVQHPPPRFMPPGGGVAAAALKGEGGVRLDALPARGPLVLGAGESFPRPLPPASFPRPLPPGEAPRHAPSPGGELPADASSPAAADSPPAKSPVPGIQTPSARYATPADTSYQSSMLQMQHLHQQQMVMQHQMALQMQMQVAAMQQQQMMGGGGGMGGAVPMMTPDGRMLMPTIVGPQPAGPGGGPPGSRAGRFAHPQQLAVAWGHAGAGGRHAGGMEAPMGMVPMGMGMVPMGGNMPAGHPRGAMGGMMGAMGSMGGMMGGMAGMVMMAPGPNGPMLHPCNPNALALHMHQTSQAAAFDRGGGSSHRVVRKLKRVPFTAEEEEYVKRGYDEFKDEKFMWRSIVDKYPFHPSRTSVDIKDKWRNIQKKRMSQRALAMRMYGAQYPDGPVHAPEGPAILELAAQACHDVHEHEIVHEAEEVVDDGGGGGGDGDGTGDGASDAPLHERAVAAVRAAVAADSPNVSSCEVQAALEVQSLRSDDTNTSVASVLSCEL